ncbi:MAG: hypothetical protein RL456_1953 [Pseudomonadota bacterium]|jgi:hypothetical protein
MTRLGYGSATDLILLELQQGPATAIELCAATGIGVRVMSSILHRLNKKGDKTPKRVCIVAWCYDAGAARPYPRAIYDLGSRRDVPKPKADPAENKRRHRARRKAATQCATGFGLARAIPTNRPSQAEKVAAAA